MTLRTRENGIVYWFTGVSGAGKSTLAKAWTERLYKPSRPVLYLDGDALREVFGNDLSHSREDRLKSAERNARLCGLLSAQGLDVAIATISLFHSVQRWNRKNLPGYCEIFVEADLPTVMQRDPKKIYRGAAATGGSNIVGLGIAPEFPENPDVVLRNDGRKTPAELLDELAAVLKNKGKQYATR